MWVQCALHQLCDDLSVPLWQSKKLVRNVIFSLKRDNFNKTNIILALVLYIDLINSIYRQLSFDNVRRTSVLTITYSLT